MSPWIVAAVIGAPLIILSVLFLRRASRQINTIVKEETSSEASDQTTGDVLPENASEATAKLAPIEAEDDKPNPDRDWARQFLADTYGLDPVYNTEDEDYRAFASALYNNGDRPSQIRNAVRSGDIALIFTTAEILAEVMSDQDLEMLAGPTEAPVLWMLRREGQLPRWAPPLFDGISLERYHEELSRRLHAARTR